LHKEGLEVKKAELTGCRAALLGSWDICSQVVRVGLLGLLLQASTLTGSEVVIDFPMDS